MSRLLASLDSPPSGRVRPIWFDAAEYGRIKLLGGVEVPWTSPADLAAFVGKLQGMFRSDAILVGIGDLLAQRVSGDERLRTAMAARTRRGYALRTMLADEHARATAVEAIRALASTKGAAPLLLTMPSPARWLAVAARQASTDLGPPDAGQAEIAAMYAADFLRTFGGAAVDGLLVDEGPARVSEVIHPEAYRAVLNVADHYGWPVVVRTEAVAAWPHGSVPGIAAWLGSALPEEPVGPWGIVAGADFWDGAEPPPDAGIVLAAVPAEADPEAVMKRVRALA
jgi:uncharacterized protein (TIGR02265 family)